MTTESQRRLGALAVLAIGCGSPPPPVAPQLPQLVADPPEIRLLVSGKPARILVRTNAPSLTEEQRTALNLALSNLRPPEVVLDRSTPYGWVVALAPRAARGHVALPDDLPWPPHVGFTAQRQQTWQRPWIMLEVSDQGERAWVDALDGRARCAERGPYGQLRVEDLPPADAGRHAVYAEAQVPWATVAAMLHRIRSRLAYSPGSVTLLVGEPVDRVSCAAGAVNRERVRAILDELPTDPLPTGCVTWTPDDPPAWARWVGRDPWSRESARSRSGQPPEVWRRWIDEGWDLDPPEEPILLRWTTYQRLPPPHEPLWSRDGGFEEGIVSVVDPIDGRACTIRYATDEVVRERMGLPDRARTSLDRAVIAARTGADPSL